MIEQPAYTVGNANQTNQTAARAATGVGSAPAYLLAKRLMDILGALVGLTLLFPVFVAIALLVVVASPGPIFHRRRVLARQNHDPAQNTPLKTFDAFKFRTMIVNADEVLKKNPKLWEEFQKDFKLREDPRVTKIGHILRRTSLDELPQLLNILCGQMSLIGPRMITEKELEKYGEPRNQTRLLAVKPGLTGLWQVSGRQNVSYAERVRLDMWYVENRSLRMDIQILLRTIGEVLRRSGAY